MANLTTGLGPILDLAGELTALSGLFARPGEKGIALDLDDVETIRTRLSLCADMARLQERRLVLAGVDLDGRLN